MITLLSSLLGFISATFPNLIQLFQDASNKKHEITLLNMQKDVQVQERKEKLEETNTQAEIAETQALYKTYSLGIGWVDALNGTVRPIIAYSFFILYATVKVMHFSTNLPWLLWTEEDQAIFSGIISFYFGQRAMSKIHRKIS